MTGAKDHFADTPLHQVYGETLVELVEEGLDIYALEADLAVANMTDVTFKEWCPQRFLDVGIAEANMISISAGLAAMGKIPFAASFGVFSSRKVVDQLFMAVTYSNLNLKVVGTMPGVDGRGNGGSHQAFEDVALMRALPNMTVLDPCDAYEVRGVVRAAARHRGGVYIRIPRCVMPAIFDADYEFEIGKATILREGRDVSIITSGYMVSTALEAAALLEQEGVSARVVNMCTIKPLDTTSVLSVARETGAIVTAENHSVIGGLGSAVCECISEAYPVPVRRVGMPDRCGEVGTVEYLCEEFGMTSNDIVREAHAALQMKRKSL